jgi:uncharacterized protein YdaU (DUF1376 family)
MTSRPIWMPLYVRDYLVDTRHLKTIQHGAYLLLIMEYWTKGRLPEDETTLRAITSLDRRQWHRHKKTIAALFDQPGWRHPRIDAELKKANELRLKRSVYGTQGGRISRGRNNVERFQVVQLDPTKSPTKR